MRRAGIAPVLWMIPPVQALGVRWSDAAARGVHRFVMRNT